MPPSQKRLTISLLSNFYSFLEQWADKEGRTASNLAAFLVTEGILEKQGDTSKVTVDLSAVSEQIEKLRSDSAWKALPLAHKVTLLLTEYLGLLKPEQSSQEKENIDNAKENLVRFFKGLAEGKTPSDADCISAALEAGIDKELALSLRDRLIKQGE